jgi:hypothetical protein
MKIMQIGSSLINMANFTSLEARSCDNGVVLTIEYSHIEREYFIPNETDPELVVYTILTTLKTSDGFDLIYRLNNKEGLWGNG